MLAGILAFATVPAHAGTLLAWGRNDFGQLGNGTNTSSNFPVAVTGLTNDVTAVAGGHLHSLAIHNGAAKAWGRNNLGQLGDGTTTDSNFPVAVTGLTNDVTAVAGGHLHSLAIHNGVAKAWGGNDYGQLGNGTNTSSSVPVATAGLGSDVTAIASGSYHNLIIHNGTAKAWGRNDFGQLGNGTSANSNVPVGVTGLASDVTAIAGGNLHTLAIHDEATNAWGNNLSRQLGIGTFGLHIDTPNSVTGLDSGVTAIASGAYHSLALQGGNVYAWGGNLYGELGNGTIFENQVLFPVLDLQGELIDVAAGAYSSYALSADGSLWVWGYNNYGQLGVGDTTNRLVPTQLFAPSGYRFTAIAAGATHALAIIEPVVAPVAGDFNSDGQVNLADYTVWRDSLGMTGTDLAADANEDHVVSASDYTHWKENFGRVAHTIPEATSASLVPEPATRWLPLLLLATMCGQRLRCCRV
jgi:alpha-tubulin suppressor-like RCC1 family protein